MIVSGVENLKRELRVVAARLALSQDRRKQEVGGKVAGMCQ